MTAPDDKGPSGPSTVQPGDSTTGAESNGINLPRQEISVLDGLLVVARNKAFIAWTTITFLLLGVSYALLLSDEYTSSATVVQNVEGEGSGGLPGGIPSGALSGLGINLGGASGGLTPQAYPKVLRSREVRLGVVRDTFRFPDTERSKTFLEYANRPPSLYTTVLKYTLRLPWTLKSVLSRTITQSPDRTREKEAEGMVFTEEEENAVLAVGGMVDASLNQENGLMNVTVTSKGPKLSASLTKSFLDHLTTRIREIRTEKVRERLDFVEGRFQEVEKELGRAEERLAQFLERNQDPTTATLQFKRDRLRRQVNFKEQLYSELQSQLTQTRLDLQRRKPVVTVVENPVPPMQPSGPNRTLIVLSAMILGAVIGLGGAFAKSSFGDWESDSEEKEKLDEIQNRLFPSFLHGAIKKLVGENGTFDTGKPKSSSVAADNPS